MSDATAITVSIIIAYLLGSIPTALWVGQVFYKKDIRQFGSGNLGATNTFRVLGKKAGTIVLLFDIFKGVAAVLIADRIGVPFEPILIGVVSVIGHMYPIFAKFKGGKAVATSAGVLLGYAPLVFFIALLIFIGLLKTTKMVSLSSMVIAVIVFLISLYELIRNGNWEFFVIITCMVSFIIYRHRANIVRNKNGTVTKIKWRRSDENTIIKRCIAMIERSDG